jgi:3-hydroxybutyryl-CoA dehydratase
VSRELQVGDTASFSKTITETDVVLFAGLTGDLNPIHVDAEYARTTRFGQRVAHGLLTAGLISTVLGTRLPGPGTIYLSQTIRFTAPVHIGDTVTATVTVTRVRQEKGIVILETVCRNQRGEEVLTGEAAVMVPELAGQRSEGTGGRS